MAIQGERGSVSNLLSPCSHTYGVFAGFIAIDEVLSLREFF